MILLDLTFHDLEQLRHEKKMTIRELTNGITSERMYRRYVREESTMPSMIFMQLMGRLGINMIQYISELNERIQGNHPEEHELVQLIKENRYQEARKLYESHDFSTLYSENRFRFLPVLILFMKLQLKWITKTDYIKEANRILDYPRILEYKVLTRVDIEALLVHLLVVDDEDMEKIAFFLLRVVEDDDIRIISHEPDITVSDIYNVVPFALMRKETLYQSDLPIIKYALKEFGVYNHPYLELFRFGIHIRNMIAYHSLTQEEEKKQMDVFHLFAYIFSHEKMTPYLKMLFEEYEEYYFSFLTFLEQEENVRKMVSTDWGDLI